MWRLFFLALSLTLIGGCTVGGIVSSPGSRSVEPWECIKINPAAKKMPQNPCFSAVLSAENEITLKWRVTHSAPLVYIFDDFGVNFKDIGFRKAVCPEEPADTCSTSVRVGQGSFHRWILQVDGVRGNRVHVSTSIRVPSLYPPEVTGGGFVDVLAPSDHHISWRADARNAPLDQTIEEAWAEMQVPGNMFFQSWNHLPRSGPDASLIVPAAELDTPGSRIYGLRDCHLVNGSDTSICSPARVASFYIGADHFTVPNPLYAKAGEDLTVSFTTRSGDVRRLFSSTLAPGQNGQDSLESIESSVVIDAARLTPGRHAIELMSCVKQSGECSPGTTLQILVDAPVSWTLERDYTKDFFPGHGYAVLGGGEPLDITYGSGSGGAIWFINEFSSSIEQVTPSGEVKSYTIPIARQASMKELALTPVKPFISGFAGTNVIPVIFSELAERATRAGTTLWFTQGGGMRGPNVTMKNHSRVVSFDPSLPDSPGTPFDDRLCVYNMPTDDVNGFGNNQIIGLTATADRIWVAEGRGIFGNEVSVISAFIPDPKSCDNLLDFEDPDALARQRLQYCKEGKTAEQDGCMEKYPLDGVLSGIAATHLETDPVDSSVWFTDAKGRFLGNLRPDREPVIEAYPLLDPHEDYSILGGVPWSLRVADDAVYFGEYGIRHIVRFDKTTRTFDEIAVPVTAAQGGLHSIDLDTRSDRLWFTISNEKRVPLDTAASTIGYVDLASWREHLENPGATGNIRATLYSGLDRIPASAEQPDQHQAFRGIAIRPTSGRIALATMWRRQVIELTPRTHFWPWGNSE